MVNVNVAPTASIVKIQEMLHPRSEEVQSAVTHSNYSRGVSF